MARGATFMSSNLQSLLRLTFEPVAVSFTNERPEGAIQFPKGKRGCVASMLVASAKKGMIVVFDEETYGCPGGGVGLCLGDMFTKTGQPIEKLLSNGDPELGKNMKIFETGERFFASPELVSKWRVAMPYIQTDKKYVTFLPLSKVNNVEPDLVFFLANPDQISVLVILMGYNRGTLNNVSAPFGAACHSILFAMNESQKPMPNAVLGFFDISQRGTVPRDILSFTVPYKVYKEMEAAAPESCLCTHAWENIAGRQQD
jgi:uncharacterized protein (DUF169 family)